MDGVLSRFEVRNSQHAAGWSIPLQLAVQKNLCLVLPGHNHEGTDILAGLHKRGERRHRTGVDIQLVFVVPYAQCELMSAGGDLRNFGAVVRHVNGGLTIKADLGRRIAAVNVEFAAKIADDHGQHAFGFDWPSNNRNGPYI